MGENQAEKPTKPTILQVSPFKQYERCPYCKSLGKKHFIRGKKCQYKCSKCNRYFTHRANYTRIDDNDNFDRLFKEYLICKRKSIKINLSQLLIKYPDLSKSSLYRKRNYIVLVETILRIARKKSDIRIFKVLKSSVQLTLNEGNLKIEFIEIQLIASNPDNVQIALKVNEVDFFEEMCIRISSVYKPMIKKDQLRLDIAKSSFESFSDEFLNSLRNSHLRNEAWRF
ncbi:hypothetical protein [Pedobacter nanyangensis]|uniref:hypothetical protein n=1 Tax=Pedobacter nanyangensis TaxID=1562389 RepID=UPI000DE4C92B|nr:hypothetical protein [Pedobacter nanyangensis]